MTTWTLTYWLRVGDGEWTKVEKPLEAANKSAALAAMREEFERKRIKPGELMQYQLWKRSLTPPKKNTLAWKPVRRGRHV